MGGYVTWQIPTMHLPIDLLIPEILNSLEKRSNLILEASPGSGKTTRVPPALLKSSFLADDREILVLEPRRLAAKYSAHRIATELGCEVGEVVGYQFRFENVTSSKTRLRFVTEGLFMRFLMSHPRLERVAAVVLDEFHERSIQSDIALGYLKVLQKTHRPDLRILLMSATLESESLSRYLDGAPIVRLQTQLHPVRLNYLPSPPSKVLDQRVRDAVLRALTETSGDLLVFLPGMADMRRCEQALRDLESARVLLLHGELSREEQDLAMQVGGGRKIILSTNVAETSLTLPGVTAVIDSGLHRRASFSWWSGIPSLKTRLISRASAIQRAGRAGRTGPGLCYRLYTQGDFETRPGFEAPEIMRSDLSQVLLDLKALGVDLRSFTWFDAPPAAALQAAEDLLHQLGATDAAGGLTEVGREMSRVPAHPRVSRMLMEASARGVLEAASWLGAALTEGRLEDGPVQESWSGYSRDHSLRKSQQLLIRSAEGWAKRTQRPGVPVPTARGSEAHAEALARSILAGFPDRVAQKRKLASSVTRGRAEDVELLLSSGGSALVAETQMTAGEEFLVLLDLQEQQTQNQKKASLRVRSWVAIQADWLLDIQPVGMIEKEECTWDAVRNRVQSSSRWMYGELVLSESALNGGDPQEVHRLLIKHGLGVNPEIASPVDWVAALTLRVGSSDEGEIESAFARAQLYQDYFKSEPRSLWSQLSPILEGKSSLTELKEIDWPKEILQCLLGDAAHHLGELLPTQLVLPSGRKAKIHYRLAQAPWVQSRLQDFFGMKKGPVLLQGRLPLLIHLLAPNYRPVQVTSDLESFWKNHYPQLRPALSRRYPRHSWPENPGLASEK